MERTASEGLVWTPDLSVGVREIDQQHEELFARASEVTGLLGRGTDASALRVPIDGLVDFTALHFGTENRLMMQHAFPEAGLHQEQHGELVDQLRRFADRLLDGLRHPEALKAVRFLSEWLTRHIAASDRELAVWLRGRGVD